MYPNLRPDLKTNQITRDGINRAIADIKVSQPDVHKQLKITGDFYNGHLYGLPKIHKNATTPPSRPIISMSGTVTLTAAT